MTSQQSCSSLQAVGELLTDLDMDRKSIVVGASRVRHTDTLSDPLNSERPVCLAALTYHAEND